MKYNYFIQKRYKSIECQSLDEAISLAATGIETGLGFPLSITDDSGTLVMPAHEVYEKAMALLQERAFGDSAVFKENPSHTRCREEVMERLSTLIDRFLSGDDREDRVTRLFSRMLELVWIPFPDQAGTNGIALLHKLIQERKDSASKKEKQ